MIYKDLDPFTGEDKFAVAGRKAEEQMAHYLKRFFGSSPEVDVLNYLRIDLQGEVAQMDHLVLHPFGLTIVESKSVAGSVQIKDDGQWIRWFNKQPQGMRSPVTQAKMQAMLLRELLSKTVKQKGFFDSVTFDVLVAISDSGTIQWPSTGFLPEVCKADQVPDRIQLTVGQRRGSAASSLSVDHRRSISDFLRGLHRPLHSDRGRASSPSRAVASGGNLADAKMDQKASPPLPQAVSKKCKHCGGLELEVQYGKYGYYFACRACEKNTNIKVSCPTCGEDGRVRKQGKDFFAECKSCQSSAKFHSNE